MVKGFIYNGKSTKNIIPSSELILGTFNNSDSVTGHQRDNIIGDTTISRPIANEYGTQYQSLEIEYGIIKKDKTPFTDAEQRTIETWLTSPKFSQKLYFYDCDNKKNEEFYCGKFTKTDWYPCAGGFAGAMFTFTNNSAYPMFSFSKDYTISTTSNFTINCETDELEEYIYPKITITSSTSATFEIINKSDNSNSMKISAQKNLPMVFDCKNCIPKDGTTSGIFTYQDLGWTDVSNIYWLRFLPGTNNLTVNGTGKLKLEFDYPYKKVGGWL